MRTASRINNMVHNASFLTRRPPGFPTNPCTYLEKILYSGLDVVHNLCKFWMKMSEQRKCARRQNAWGGIGWTGSLNGRKGRQFDVDWYS